MCISIVCPIKFSILYLQYMLFMRHIIKPFVNSLYEKLWGVEETSNNCGRSGQSPEWMCIIDKDPNAPDPWELAVFSGWTEIDSLQHQLLPYRHLLLGLASSSSCAVHINSSELLPRSRCRSSSARSAHLSQFFVCVSVLSSVFKGLVNVKTEQYFKPF